MNVIFLEAHFTGKKSLVVPKVGVLVVNKSLVSFLGPHSSEAMHLAALQGWRHPKVLQVLLEARGDPCLVSAGVPVLACCKTAE